MGCSCLTIIVGIVLIHISKAALPTGCTSGTPTCPSNSACKTDACVCNDGFKLDSTKNGCEAKVFGDSCDSTNGCTGSLNTACTNSKCECAAGYVENNSVCTNTRVTAVVCKAAETDCVNIDHADFENQEFKCNAGYTSRVSAVACQTAGTECDGIDHADCENQKCKCNAGYMEDPNDGTTCVKIIGGSCSGTTACPGDPNTICKNSYVCVP